MLSVLIASALLVAAQDPAVPPPALDPPAKGVEVAPAEVPGQRIVYGIVEGKNAPKTGKVCFKDPVLGSKIPTRRCMDVKEFRDRQAQERDFLGQVQRAVRVPGG